MASFRELFDEQEREEILLAMQARETAYKGRIKAALRGETSRGVVTVDKLEAKLDMVQSIIKTLIEESN